MALGATPHAIMQIVGRESIVLGAFGVAVGLPCALIAGRFLRTMLYGLEPSDPVKYDYSLCHLGMKNPKRSSLKAELSRLRASLNVET